MGYVGNQTTNSYSSLAKQTITGDGGTSYTLDHAVANAQEVEIFVNNVRQAPGVAYTVNGTALTMTGNVESSDDFYVVFQGKALQTVTPPDLSVTTAKIVDANVTTAKIADDAVTSAKLDTNIAIDGDLTVNTSTLKVDSTNNRIGVGTTSPTRLVDLSYSDSTTYSSSDFDSSLCALRIDNNDTTANAGAGIFFQVGSNGEAAISATRVGDGTADMCFGTRGGGARAERMRLRNTGELLLGLTSGGSSNRLHVKGAATTSVFQNDSATSATMQTTILFRNASSGNVGAIQNSSTGTSYATTSDHRAKQNVEDMTGAIARVKQLQPKRFSFIADTDDTMVDGFLAHEAQTVVPEAVNGTHNEVDDDGNAVMQSIDQGKLVPVLTAALKEAIAKIETLETKVAALENA